MELNYKGKYISLDKEDLWVLDRFNWYFCNDYLKYSLGKIKLTFHRIIMDCPEEMFIDHINRNRLDNRKKNLRVCTHKENMRNRSSFSSSSSHYKGVCWDKENCMWISSIYYNNKQIIIGRFIDEIEAAISYDLFADKLYGEYAYLNFS